MEKPRGYQISNNNTLRVCVCVFEMPNNQEPTSVFSLFWLLELTREESD